MAAPIDAERLFHAQGAYRPSSWTTIFLFPATHRPPEDDGRPPPTMISLGPRTLTLVLHSYSRAREHGFWPPLGSIFNKLGSELHADAQDLYRRLQIDESGG